MIQVFSLNLRLTSKCNYNCLYCPNEKKDLFMSREVIDKAVEWFKLYGRSKGSYTYIELSGGEVTQVPELLGYAFNVIDKDIIVKVITNGSGFRDSSVRRIFEENSERVDLVLSIDGRREYHDSNRRTVDGRGTFDLIDFDFVRSLKWHDVVVSLVCTTWNVDTLYDRVVDCMDMGFREVGISVDHTRCWKEEELVKYELELCRLMNHVRSGDLELSTFKYITQAKVGNVRYCSCTDDYMSEYTVLEDGSVTPCKGFSDVFGRMIEWRVILGDINNWRDRHFGFSWNVTYDGRTPECDNCISSYRCGCVPVRVMKYVYRDKLFDSICRLNQIEDKVWECWYR